VCSIEYFFNTSCHWQWYQIAQTEVVAVSVVVVTVVVVPADVVSVEPPTVVVATVAVDPPAAVVAVVGAPACSHSPAAPQVYPGQHLPLFAQIIFLHINKVIKRLSKFYMEGQTRLLHRRGAEFSFAELYSTVNDVLISVNSRPD